MTKFKVDLVKYDMDKTKKRKRADFFVKAKSEEAVIQKLEEIHKGEKVKIIHEIQWGAEQIIDLPKVQRLTGEIKFFDEQKGFGFIQPDEDMEDLFFHASALGGEEIYDRDFVEFEISQTPKGAVAIKIKLID
jgi:CspA family cold shock protein